MENLNTLCIRQANELCIHNGFETFNKTFVYKLIEEEKVVHAVVQSPANAELNEVFFEIHEFVFLYESYFGFNHPELSQVARCIGILCAEGRTESVDLSQSHSTQFAFELSADGECGLFAKEIVGIVYLSVFVFLEVIEVLGRYLEHLSGTFAVRSGDKRCVEVEVSVLMEIGVNSHGHVMTDTEYSSERVSTRTKMCDSTQELHGKAFLLQRILFGISSAVHFEFGELNFYILSCALRRHKDTGRGDARAGSNGFELFFRKLCQVHNDLYVLNCRTVIERDEVYGVIAATTTHPATDVNRLVEILALESVYDNCSL